MNKNHVFLKIISGICVTLFGSLISLSQSIYTKKESLVNLPNVIMKNEISSFTITRIFDSQKNYHSSKTALKKLPMYKCMYNFVGFTDNFFSRYEWLVTISADEHDVSRIKTLRFVPYGKGSIYFPDSAFNDLTDPIFCINENEKKSDCKVFYSRDRVRLYIYMLNGKKNNKYEVTWIIQNNKYYGRVIDKIED